MLFFVIIFVVAAVAAVGDVVVAPPAAVAHDPEGTLVICSFLSTYVVSATLRLAP